MHEKPIRITQPDVQDIPVLKRIWMDTFGDPPELIEAFFDRFPPARSGWIVCCGDEILSTAYLMLGNSLMHGDQAHAAAYVYAVATPTEHRGKGYAGMLMRHFAQIAEERKLLLYTRPANESLFHWYAKTMHTVPAAPLSLRQIAAKKSADLPSVQKTSSTDYGGMREAFLSALPHIILSEAFLSLQEFYLEAENGGYYSVNGGICACEVHGDTLVVKELLARDDDEVVQALMQYFKVSKAQFFAPSASGKAQVAYRGAAQSHTNWGLLLD